MTLKEAYGGIQFYGTGEIRKYWASEYALLGPLAAPFEIKRTGPNKVMFGGGSAMWEALMGRWGGGYWDTGSFIGVGNSGADEVQTYNALQGTSQILKVMDGGYPIHTDGLVTDALNIQFRSTFSFAEANFHWREWAVFNSSQSRMLNRKSQDNGVKTVDMTWEFLVTIRLEC